MAKLVAKTYGDALFELAVEEGKVDSLVEEAAGVLQILEENTDLQKLMNHPKISKDEKISVMENIFKDRVSDSLTGFLKIVVSKDRYSDIREIFEYFIETVKEYKNIGTAYVTTAVELKESQKKDLVNKLLSTTKYEKLEIIYTVDSSIIGGMVVRIKDRVVDSSIKNKLYELSKDLTKIQLA